MDFTNLKVLVIGDICLDQTIDGSATRLSPEAPVPVVHNPELSYTLGMAGNVALNLRNLGAEVHIETICGKDEANGIIQKLLNYYEIQDIQETIKIQDDVQGRWVTTTKTRIVANGQQLTRIDIEEYVDNPELYEQFADIMDKNHGINKFDFVVISDYNKGIITETSWKYIKPVLDKVNKSGIYFVDTKKTNVWKFYVEDFILFPNTKELNKILNEAGYNSTLDDLQEFMDDMQWKLLVETASENGANIYNDKLEHWNYAAHTQQVFDVCGAGDTFIAAFSLAYYQTKNHHYAAKFANHCCSKVVMKKGTVPITYEEAAQYDYQG